MRKSICCTKFLYCRPADLRPVLMSWMIVTGQLSGKDIPKPCSNKFRHCGWIATGPCTRYWAATLNAEKKQYFKIRPHRQEDSHISKIFRRY
ncbi:hypothetical protein PHSY_006048 [Pseudozyma hubeiensis SY62]|uniref:Uncharacterized protein n=1 Tax=Pseudozyma hubeiensis (strain SY62) TaxID=1305764 RepID=R9PAT1_PSEHS|nr:hypothetical protein PHSY_006048 [Pseudozyma hubeiensis SY62]GAC98454.1 hypothetical protein PHSY_006048 [Pseudozyma hubeiensis SY62]